MAGRCRSGHYELTFGVADYFAQRNVPMSDPPFLDRIPLRFSLAEPEGHFHVPLLVTAVELCDLSGQLNRARPMAPTIFCQLWNRHWKA